MKEKQKIIKIILISLLTIILGIGVSYAFYAAIINGNETTTTLQLEAGVLSIKYDGGDIIEADGFLPGSEAFATKTFTLTGNNDSELNMPYNLSLIIDENTFNEGSLSYRLSGVNTSNNGDILLEGNKTISGESMNLGKGYFAPGATNAVHTFVIKFYYPDDGTDQSDEMNASFKAHIKVEGARITDKGFDVLIAQNNAYSTTSKAFNGPITKEQVEKIVIKNTNEVPSNAIASWDVSVAGNGSIMAYTLDEDNDSLYELYIGQDNGVIVGSNASYLFGYYKKLESIDLTNLKTSKVTNMRYMFHSSTVTILDLSSFDTSKVTNMYMMFCQSAATSLDLSSFDTSNVTDMSGMFLYSSATEIKGLTKFNTSKVTDMSSMFVYSKATSLNLSNFDTSNVTNMYDMFLGSAATNLDLSNFDTSKVTNMSAMFKYSSATEIKGLNKFNTSNVTDMSSMFDGSEATILVLSGFDTSNVTSMSWMFAQIKATSLDLSSFDTSNVTNMGSMFRSSAATEIIKGLDKFDTSNVTNMSYMFSGTGVTSLDLSNFNTSNVTNMSRMFRQSKIITLDLSSFDTNNVTDMSYMFQNASTTTGYARTQTDADKFNASSNKPSGLTFVVKS